MKSKKVMILLTAAMIMGTLSSSLTVYAADEVAASEIPASGARVDVVSSENGDVFFYVPASSELLAVRTCTTPVLVVMSDTKYTEENVISEAEKTGIAQIADKEGAVAVFLNAKGEKWETEDLSTYTDIFTSFTDDSNLAFINGRTENGTYAATLQRIYVFADGSAADFAAQNFNKELNCFVDYGMYQINNDVTPAYTALFNPTVEMPSTKDYANDIPMAAVNPEDLDKASEALALLAPVSQSSYVTDGVFGESTVVDIYDEHMSKYRRQAGAIIDIPDLGQLGVAENVVSRDVAAGSIKCYEYTTDSFADAEDGTIPMVVLFHGGGNHAQYIAWASGWLDIASEENLYIVSVDKHVGYTSTDIIELLDQIKEEHPQIDSSRVYAYGFSMGAVKSWNLAIKYPEYFAGIMPCDAGYMSETDENASKDNVTIEEDIPVRDVTIPIFYVAGGQSFTHEDVALEENGTMNNVGVILQRIFEMNQVSDDYFYDESQNVNWGITPAETFNVHNTTFNNEMEISGIASEDGKIYTMLCFDPEKSHETYAQDTIEAWSFISQFSRNEDGTIVSLKSE